MRLELVFWYCPYYALWLSLCNIEYFYKVATLTVCSCTIINPFFFHISEADKWLSKEREETVGNPP